MLRMESLTKMDIVKLYLYNRYKVLKYTESHMPSPRLVSVSSLSVIAVAVGVFDLAFLALGRAGE